MFWLIRSVNTVCALCCLLVRSIDEVVAVQADRWGAGNGAHHQGSLAKEGFTLGQVPTSHEVAAKLRALADLETKP